MDPHLSLLLNLPPLGDLLRTLEPGEWVSVISSLAAILMMLLGSAMVAGSENAFFSISPAKIQELRNETDKASIAIVKLLDKPKVLLATILVTNNFINVAFVLVSSYVYETVFNFVDYPTLGFLIQVVLITFIIVFLGEITPKIYATNNYESFSRIMAVPMVRLSRLLKPITYLLVNSTAIIDKRITRKGHQVTVDDLEHAIDITSETDSSEEEKEILRSIVNFGFISVKEIMRSRMDVKALDASWTFAQIGDRIREWEYSRMPVYRETFDQVLGILNIKDLIPHLQEPDFPWTSLVKEAYFVPETKKIDDLLKEFQKKRVHMAVVVDEYGGSCGIVTMEDIMEEIFGDIQDEFDVDEAFYQKLDDNNWVFEGKALLLDVCRWMDLEPDTFDDVKGENETLGGLILEKSGHLPTNGAEFSIAGFLFKVESVDRRKIKRVKISRIA